MTKHKYHFLLLFFGCFAVHHAISQSIPPSIGMQVDTAIYLQTGLNTLDIQLYNDTEEDFEGRLELVLPSGLRSIGESHISVQVKAGKKRYLSIKLQSQQLSLLKDKELLVKINSSDGVLLLHKRIQLSVAENRSVVVMDNSELQYLQEVGDSVYVKLRVLNNGTTDEQVRLVLSSPDRMGQRDFKAVPLSLYAGQDTLVQFGILVERYMLQLPQYTLRVSGLYDNDDVFGNTAISFQNRASSRNFQRMFHTDNLTYNYSRNFVDLQMDQSLGGTRMYVLRSEGTYRMMEGQLKYNLHVNQWGDVFTRPNISNTFLEYEKNNKTWTIGNIQESLEAPFYGRGASFAVRDSLKDNHFSVGVIERSNDLLGYYGAIGNPGMSGFARLVLGDQDPGRKRYEGQLYYDNNRLDSTNSLLWTNSFDLIKKEKAEQMQLRAFVAGGVSSYQANPLEEVQVEPSAALGLKLVGRTLGNFSYSSDNFYSTPYYTGNRRGAIQLIQRVNKTWRKTGYGAGVTYSRYNPSYFNPRFAAHDNSMLKLDMTFYRPISPFVTLNIQPSYNSEEASYWMMNDRIQLSTQSWQLMGSANIRSKNYRHSLYTSVETGMIAIEDYSDRSFIMRSNLTYHYGKLGLSAMYQHGAFRVFEVLNDHLFNQSFGSRLMLSSSYGGALFNGKLTWNGNIASHVSSSYGNTYSTSLSTTYRLLRNTLLTGNVRYSYTDAMSGYQYDFTNIRLGVRQNLRSRNLDRPAVKTGNIQVFCYYDNNNNNVFDDGDEIAAGYSFLIKGVNFVTDRRGRAQFKKVPYGEYSMFFPTSNGYQGVSRTIDLHSKSVSLAIPLQRVTTVRGGIMIRYDAKMSLDANLSLDLYTIIAKDQSDKTYEVRTNQHGEFVFSLPQGEYTVFIKEDTLPDNIFSEDKLRTIKVEIGRNQELEPFVLQVRNRAVEIKRFGN